MDFDKLCKVFVMEEPFYGIILSSIQKFPVNNIETLGVGRNGNVFKLVYNPDFCKAAGDDVILQALKHEVLHLVFEHLWLDAEMGWKSPQDLHYANIAEDLEVNCYVDKAKLNSNPAVFTGFFPEDFGFDRTLGSREYFKLVTKNKNKFPPPPPQQGSMGGNGSGNCNGMPKPGGLSKCGTHQFWPKDIDKSSADMIRQQVEAMVAFAADEVEKNCGTVPGEMAMIVERIRKKAKPVADWRKFCRRYLGNEYTYLTKKSRRRESARFPDAAGTRHQRKSRILVAIDTSGSVSMDEYKEFMGQILTMKQAASFRILECDARIQHEYEFNGKIQTKLHGGGGTSFQPVVDYYINRRHEFDCLVYFTDGYCDVPKNTPKDTLWVISSKGDQTRSKFRVNGSQCVFIPKKEN